MNCFIKILGLSTLLLASQYSLAGNANTVSMVKLALGEYIKYKSVGTDPDFSRAAQISNP
jgi:hypothetical protein